ncbi:IS4 family transposase, partial [Bacillus thuringiensis]
MSLSIQEKLRRYSQDMYRHLSLFLLEELAKELGFVKRRRKISGKELGTICIWVSQRTASDSLVRLCSQLHAATGTLMSPEGLNKRF